MFRLFVFSFKNFRANFKKYAAFEFLAILFTSFIWVPILTYIYKITLRWMGFSTLLNKDVYNVVLSYKGILGILLIFILCVTMVFIESGVLIIISQKYYFKKEVNVMDTLFFVLKRIPKLFSLGIFQIVPFFLLIILPLNSPFIKLIQENINLPILIANRLNRPKIYWIAYGIILVAFIYLLIRSVFAIHFIVIKGQRGSKAILSSLRITRKNEIRIMVYLMIFNAVIFLVGIAIMYVSSGLIKWLLMGIQNPLISNYLITLSSYLTYLLILLVMPINIIFVTSLFYYFTYGAKEPVDDVHLKKHKRLSKIEDRVIYFFAHRRYLFSLIVVLYLTITFLFNYSFTEKIFNWDIVVAAHRGYNGAPDNSLSAIREALERGVGAIEIDVQMTKDGILVLNHDKTLKKAVGWERKVSSLNYDELKNLVLGFDINYPNEKILTLEEALLEIDGKTKVIIDVKSYSSIPEVAAKVVQVVEKYNHLEDTYVQSFNQFILKKIRSINPDIQIGVIMFASTGNLSLLDVDFYTINQYMLSEAFVKNTHELDREVWVWTVNLERNIREVLKYRVDGIITDYPERVHDVLSE